jgi:hypothetical protein
MWSQESWQVGGTPTREKMSGFIGLAAMTKPLSRGNCNMKQTGVVNCQPLAVE